MTPAWAQRQEELLRDCIVSPDVFDSMVDRLREFVVPYQHALETEAGQRNVHLYLQGLLSHLPRKNAEDIATLVDVERLVMQDFIGTAPWDHRPLITVLVGQVVDQLGEPDGIIACHPAVGHLLTPHVQHFQALLVPRLILHLQGHVAFLTPSLVPCPVLGQGQAKVEQGMVVATDVPHEDPHLAVIDLAPVPTPLPLHPYRVGTPLGEAAGVEGDDAIGFP